MQKKCTPHGTELEESWSVCETPTLKGDIVLEIRKVKPEGKQHDSLGQLYYSTGRDSGYEVLWNLRRKDRPDRHCNGYYGHDGRVTGYAVWLISEDEKNALVELNEKKNPEFLRLVEILEENDFKVHADKFGEDMDIEFWSDAGEDMYYSISAKNGAEFAREFEEISDYFDVEEHVHKNLDAKENGVAGVPDVVTLVDDARAIEEFLKHVAYQLREAFDPRKSIKEVVGE